MSISRARPREEVVIPLRVTPSGEVAPATHVRSTLIVSSPSSLRARGKYDEYLTHLAAPFREAVLHAVAGAWLPLDVGAAHYEAANATVRSPQEQFDIGREVGERIQLSVFSTLVRLAKGVGATPWAGVEYFQRLWARCVQGGSSAVYRLGPKEARVECHGVSLVRYSYFRNGWRGMIAGAGSLFCGRMYVTEISTMTTDLRTAFRLAWA